jgi:hypothetical protein
MYFLGIFLEELAKTVKIFGQDSNSKKVKGKVIPITGLCGLEGG